MTPAASSSRRFLKPFLVALLLLCFCFALLGLLGTRNEIDLAPIADTRLLLLALGLQIVASILFILAWKTVLRLAAPVQCSFAECGAHIGVTLLGKYLPGKVWGLLGRSYLLTRRGVASGLSLNLLLTDQYVTFYTGIMLGGTALLAMYDPVLALVVAILSCLLYPVSLRYYDRIMAAASRLLHSITQRVGHDEQPVTMAVNLQPLKLAYLVYSGHWLTTSLVLFALFYPAMAEAPFIGYITITAAIPLAMLLGFVAVWAPGGIGVREGTIVAILAMQFPLDFALSIAIYYRIICVAIDVLIGGFAVFYLLKRSPQLLTPELQAPD